MTLEPIPMRCDECGAIGTAVEWGICCRVKIFATGPQKNFAPSLSARPHLRTEASTLPPKEEKMAETDRQTVLRLSKDGVLSEDEIACYAPHIKRSEITRILFAERAEERQRKRNQETLDRIMAPWAVK